MASFPEFSFRRWSAWAAAMPDADAWRSWARGDAPLPDGEEAAAVKAMPPLLRRRARPAGRAALDALYAPALAYDGQPIIFCSRNGELDRSLALLQSLAAEGQVSPQEFSMSVHNAIPGLFQIAQKSRAPVSALASENQMAFSGITEALAQLADGVPSVILMFCDAPLPMLLRPFMDGEPPCFAYAVELVPGHDCRLVHNDSPSPAKSVRAPRAIAPSQHIPSTHAIEAAASQADPSPLALLRFALDETRRALPLTDAADWQLRRFAPETRHA
ncbi:MAG: beta-ketoacyl synthase chain length factor [Azoarcus sp.]|jgi:hypothetical protein|nr:beta-ketoacyl synthase chain length factor [Azoarcus sp.]